MAYQVGVAPSAWNYWRTNLSTSNLIAAAVSVSERVQVTNMACFIAGGQGGTGVFRLCIWNSANALVAVSDQFNSGAGGGGSGRQRWEWHPPSSTTVLEAGTYRVGWWRSTSTWGEFSFVTGTDSFIDGTGGLGALSGSSQSGQIGRLLQVESAPAQPPAPPPPPVTPTETASAAVWNASTGTWVACNSDVWDATQGRWVPCNAYVWNAVIGQWVQTRG